MICADGNGLSFALKDLGQLVRLRQIGLIDEQPPNQKIAIPVGSLAYLGVAVPSKTCQVAYISVS